MTVFTVVYDNEEWEVRFVTEEDRHQAGKHNQKTHGHDGAVAWEKKQTSEGTVWTSGKDRITNTASGTGPYDFPDEEVEKAIIPRLNHLKASNPIAGPDSSVDLRIERGYLKVDGRTAYGAAVTGTGKLKLSAVTAQVRSPNEPTHTPARRNKRYFSETVLVHEWGHAIDTRKGPRETLPDLPSPSKYGATNGRESYAENFAEYYLSRGKTTVVSAQQAAKEFGWQPK